MGVPSRLGSRIGPCPEPALDFHVGTAGRPASAASIACSCEHSLHPCSRPHATSQSIVAFAESSEPCHQCGISQRSAVVQSHRKMLQNVSALPSPDVARTG